MVTIRLAGLLPVHAARVLVLKAWGADIGPGVTIYHGVEVRGAHRLVIGARSSIGNGSILDARGGLTIGSDVNLSTAVHIWSAQHDWRSPGFDYVTAPVAIGDRVWLSARSTVLPGTTVGENAVLAAGGVAARDLDADTVYGGVPAKRITSRPVPQTYHLAPASRKVWWW